jgi:hypothetical protein
MGLLACFSPPTAKLESCWLSRLLSHFGHAALLFPRTIASKRCWHCWQMYSKIGIWTARWNNDNIIIELKHSFKSDLRHD